MSHETLVGVLLEFATQFFEKHPSGSSGGEFIHHPSHFEAQSPENPICADIATCNPASGSCRGKKVFFEPLCGHVARTVTSDVFSFMPDASGRAI